MSREAFAARLRRTRELRRITLEEVSEQSKISLAVWESLERADLSRWPSGLFARAYVRAYAEAVGLDAESTIDEFCRWFPEGDRRLDGAVRATAEVIGLESQWRDDHIRHLRHGERRGAGIAARDRGSVLRASALDESTEDLTGDAEYRAEVTSGLARRLLAAGLDMSLVGLVAALFSNGISSDGWANLALTAILYHTLSPVVLGHTPGTEIVQRQMRRLMSVIGAYDRPARAQIRK